MAAEGGELLVEIAAVVFAIFGDEFFERGLLAHEIFLRGEGRLELEIGSLKFDPAGRAIVDAGMVLKVGGVAMAAAHEHADAVVSAGKNELRAAGAEAFGASAAERVAEKDGVVAGAVRSVDALLKVRAHLDAERVQAHGNGFEVDRVRGAGDDVLDFAREDLAVDEFETH